MRIAHLCLSNWYIDGVYYQENQLIAQHVRDGHDVLVVASTEVQRAGVLKYEKPGRFVGPEGAEVIRLPYRLWPHKLARKLRAHPGVYGILSEFKPDAILFHGTCGWDVQTAARYARDNPNVAFYIDSHEDHYNSARGFISREILHKRFYGPCLRRALPHARKILCITPETVDFVRDTYRVPPEKLELYPLGGIPVESPEYEERRVRTRAALGLKDEILFVQSGKQTARKRLLDSLRAFKIAPPNARLIIAGSLGDDIGAEAERLIADSPSVSFVGWKSPEELTDLLCAADVYLQPGTQSVTMQHSLCCRCAVILDDVPSHRPYVDRNGWLVSGDLAKAIASVGLADLAAMQRRSFEIAVARLDYAKLGQRVLK